MLKYKLIKNTNEKSPFCGQVYARAYYDETIGLEQLAEHMASHNSPFSAGTIHGVLKDMVACIKELVLESKKVKIDDLAIISLGLHGQYATSPKVFNPAHNIKKANIKALGTGSFAKKELDLAVKYKEVEEYVKEG